ncbi:hypothetical protein [Salipiger mucosus]|uniref:Uncharacterized protein n=1 Tax=Salipiger mucosus DSM 16094 TaxID=1123237 RepID=S9QKQ0_9RHOB|nr:hypothetical protein [Salipiger mucosus]EPX80372.1 hypothetical protein Salmuc_03688 [Salipiger mucosus DSM 16094]
MTRTEIENEVEKQKRVRRVMYIAETILVSGLLFWFVSALTSGA